MAFLTLQHSADEATALSAAYQQFLVANGGRELASSGKVSGAKLVEMMGTVELVFSHGKVVGGVHAANNREDAEQAGALLYAKIAEASK